MTKKKLAIIGANEAITMLINKAKQLGYETHVFAWKCGDPGEYAADYFYPISIDKKDLILEMCKKIGICGICSITSDFAAPTVAYVARKLGLPGNPERTDVVARNKYEMRKAFRSYGDIFCPKFAELDIHSNIESTLNGFSYPLIVKPVDRWSSKGITRVDSTEGIKSAIEYAASESISGKVIVEEFMEGPEYSAECIVYKGKTTVIAYTEKITTGFPHYIEIGHKQPANISTDKQKEIERIVVNAVKALDITNSAAHVEFRLLENGDIGIIEIGARMGGDCIGTDLTPYSSGMDYIKMVIDVACGIEPDFGIIRKPIPVQIRFIINKKDIDDFNSIDPMIVIRRSEFDNSFNDEVVDSSTRHGYYINKIESVCNGSNQSQPSAY